MRCVDLKNYRSGGGCWLYLYVYKIFVGCSVSFIVMKMEDKIADDVRIMYSTPEILLQRPPAGASDTVAARLVIGWDGARVWLRDFGSCAEMVGYYLMAV